MKGLPQNVLLNFRLEIPKSDLTIYLPSGISEIFCQMVSTPEMLKKLKKIISCIFVLLAYRICLSVLKLGGGGGGGEPKRNRVRSNQQQRARSIYRLHRFCRARPLMLIKIAGESVKFIGSKNSQKAL